MGRWRNLFEREASPTTLHLSKVARGDMSLCAQGREDPYIARSSMFLLNTLAHRLTGIGVWLTMNQDYTALEDIHKVMGSF